MELFQILTAISSSKQDVLRESNDPFPERSYPAFVVNRCMSYHPDMVIPANHMNMFPGLPAGMQFDYLRLVVPQRKRRAMKWYKPEKDEEVALIQAYYSVNRRRAEQYHSLLSGEQIEEIRKWLYRGGR